MPLSSLDRSYFADGPEPPRTLFGWPVVATTKATVTGAALLDAIRAMSPLERAELRALLAERAGVLELPPFAELPPDLRVPQ